MHTCDMGKQINQDKLEAWLVENLKAEADKHNAEIKKKKTTVKNPIDTAKLWSKIEKLKDLYLSELLPRHMYEQEYKALMEEISRAEAAQKEAEDAPVDTSVFKDFAKMYQTLSPKDKKAFWSRIIKQIHVFPDGSFKIIFL